MKTRIFASIIITAALASSAVATELSIEETYSGALPNVTQNDYGLGSYYVEPVKEISCTQYDLDPLSVVYPEPQDSVSDYLAPPTMHVVCLREPSSRG